MAQLQIKQTIKTALNIYLDRFKEFYRLAFINSFWIFVPVYGWAKYAAMMGLFARLAYGDVSGNRETLQDAKRYIKPKTWSFFGAGLMASLIYYLKSLRISIAILALFWLSLNYKVLSANILSNPLIYFVNSGILFCYYYWLKSHLLLYELPLATTRTVNTNQSLDIAWQLAESRDIFKLEFIVLIFTSICALFYLGFSQVYSFASFNSLLQSTTSYFNFWGFNLFAFSGLFWSFLGMSHYFFFGTLFIPIFPVATQILSSTIIPHPNIIMLFLNIIFKTLILGIIGALLIPFLQSLKAVI